MKRKYSILVCVCLILTLFTATAYATCIETTDYQIKFTYINSFDNLFYISSNGEASVSSFLEASNVDSVKVTAKLQQYKDGYWNTIKIWSETKDGTSCGAGGKWYVASEYQYRMVSYGYTYENGEMVESTSYTSEAEFY